MGEILRPWKWHYTCAVNRCKPSSIKSCQGCRLRKTDRIPCRVLLSQIPRGTCAGLSPSSCEITCWGASRIPAKHEPCGHLLVKCHHHKFWRIHRLPCRAADRPRLVLRSMFDEMVDKRLPGSTNCFGRTAYARHTVLGSQGCWEARAL